MTLPGDYIGDSGTDDTGVDNSGTGNPAWSEFLEAVPQELHSKVTPILEKWDKGVQERFSKVQSSYEPWKEFLDAGIDPGTARFGLNLLNSLNDNPQMVWNAIGDYYKFNKGPATQGDSDQGQEEPNKPEDPYAAYSSKLAQIEHQNQVISQVLIKQQEAKLAAEQDQKLDSELASLAKKYGEFDEQFVLAKMQANNLSGEKAVEAYFNWRDAEIKKHRPRPLIMGGGGMVPGQNVDVKKLNESQTKDLVVQMLSAAAEQNRH